MFKEFMRISWRGTGIALLGGTVGMLVMGIVYRFTGFAFAPHLIFAVGLVGARIAEALYSHNCCFRKALTEGGILALLGILLVYAEDAIISL
ncbi:MAG: hypothetical protein FH749_12735 [Firmicutes bacterium]|nr:hypothetical protein [Bacillota bacterium]